MTTPLTTHCALSMQDIWLEQSDGMYAKFDSLTNESQSTQVSWTAPGQPATCTREPGHPFTWEPNICGLRYQAEPTSDWLARSPGS